MPDQIDWGFFDRHGETFDSHRKLPHKEQTGAITFVTMRLADSMPLEVVQQWHDDIENWLKKKWVGWFQSGRCIEFQNGLSTTKN